MREQFAHGSMTAAKMPNDSDMDVMDNRGWHVGFTLCYASHQILLCHFLHPGQYSNVARVHRNEQDGQEKTYLLMQQERLFDHLSFCPSIALLLAIAPALKMQTRLAMYLWM